MNIETLSLQLQIARGICLQSWGVVTGNPYDQMAGKHLRMEGETQYSMVVSRQQMLARRKLAPAAR